MKLIKFVFIIIALTLTAIAQDHIIRSLDHIQVITEDSQPLALGAIAAAVGTYAGENGFLFKSVHGNWYYVSLDGHAIHFPLLHTIQTGRVQFEEASSFAAASDGNDVYFMGWVDEDKKNQCYVAAFGLDGKYHSVFKLERDGEPYYECADFAALGNDYLIVVGSVRRKNSRPTNNEVDGFDTVSVTDLYRNDGKFIRELVLKDDLQPYHDDMDDPAKKTEASIPAIEMDGVPWNTQLDRDAVGNVYLVRGIDNAGPTKTGMNLIYRITPSFEVKRFRLPKDVDSVSIGMKVAGSTALFTSWVQHDAAHRPHAIETLINLKTFKVIKKVELDLEVGGAVMTFDGQTATLLTQTGDIRKPVLGMGQVKF